MPRTIKNTILHWTRALHTYATMLALILLVFFSFTGFVMNHGGFFGLDATTEVTTIAAMKMPPEMAGGSGGYGTEHAMKVEGYLRQREGARGELAPLAFSDMPDSIEVTFEAAGLKLVYQIDKKDGTIEKRAVTRNLMAHLSDLHKGTGTGGAWRLLIDATALFLLFASLSGAILWISMPKRRALGIIALTAGVALCGGCYLFLLA